MKNLKLFILALLSVPSFACDITVSSGANLHAYVASYAGGTICLNTGTYNLGSSTLQITSGTRLEGVGADRNQIIVNSSADRALSLGNDVIVKNFLLVGAGSSSGYGILNYYNNNVIIWGLSIKKFKINIGVVGSTSINIWDTFLSENGDVNNSIADPNIWITDSNDVTYLYGEIRGRANGPGGDGEIAAYNSNNVIIENTGVIDSGASAIYLVNCDYCKVLSTTIHRPGEWGIDVVNGSDYFEAANNYVAWANYGGSVFDEAGSIGGTFSGNIFHQNRRLNVGNCNGINVLGSTGGVTISGNSSNPTGQICSY